MERAIELLSEMSPAEKIYLPELIARDLSDGIPGIVQTTGVSEGEPRVAGTRIPVWVLVQYRKLGVSEADRWCAEDFANA